MVVYRDSTHSFRGIVIQDGGVTKPAFSTMNLSIPGFYQASTSPAARMTALVGDGRPFLSERLQFNGQLIATGPFASTAGPKWDNPTFPNLPLPPGASTALVQVSPDGLLSDCLSFSAVVLSTEVQDSDGDGPIDVWESSTTTIVDPMGQPLPNLRAMGADPGQNISRRNRLHVHGRRSVTRDRCANLRGRAQASALPLADTRGTQARRGCIRERTDRQDKRAL